MANDENLRTDPSASAPNNPQGDAREPSLPSVSSDQVIQLLKERGDVTYIVDRGLIQFAKFAVAALALFGMLGVFLFGWDIKKASEEARKASDEAKETHLQIQQTMLQIQETNNKLNAARKELDQSKAEFGQFVTDSKKNLQTMLDDASASRARMAGIEQDSLAIQLRINRMATESGENVTAITNLAVTVRKPATSDTPSPVAPDKLIHVALVSEVKKLAMTDLKKIAAALEKQVTRDVEPIWHVQASITPYKSLDSVPADYWPIIIKQDIGTPGMLGLHADQNSQPYALVTYEEHLKWTSTASHELLGMLVDPFGNRTLTGPSPDPAANKGNVNFLVEICQPVEGEKQNYQVDGISVSDFVTPDFYDVTKKNGAKYSFRGSVDGPLKVARDGFFTWFDDQKEWYMLTWYSGPKPEVRKLGLIDK